MAIYSGYTHWKWWFSIVMLVYQRVSEWVPGPSEDLRNRLVVRISGHRWTSRLWSTRPWTKWDPGCRRWPRRDCDGRGCCWSTRNGFSPRIVILWMVSKSETPHRFGMFEWKPINSGMFTTVFNWCRISQPSTVMCVKQCHLHHPPVITIFIGGIFTIRGLWHCFTYIIHISVN